MRSIVVPTDFSPVALNAAHFAADMALAISANILLVHIYHVPLAYSADVPVMPLSIDEIRMASIKKLEEIKEQLDRRTSGKINISTKAKLGDTIEELELLCKEQQPFAVVMGATGKTAIEKVFFGSTALSAIRHLNQPVICVPPGKEYGKGIQRIGFACDFKHVTETVPVKQISEIVKMFGAELHILNVDYREKHFTPETPLESFHLHHLFEYLHPKYHYIDHPDLGEGIQALVQANKLDLVIAVPKKHKLLEGIFQPAGTKKMIAHLSAPVMCIH